ncbi:hypothetical protein C8N43_1129 [Litoreibacter ponti]|uniref:Uncharacterized protein n=1 Tax=Litoreibacter ponti TaxID=1510457 RepID=A0A2T6BK76_9RHOB|nr:hypothetical protein [Litoreibacter ponti]PTX56470.1 hypothetical protein C8N43_1129 [Litoreibacter ponti]
MGRHLVLTVHGIGEQRPGETVDAIVGAATTQFKDGDVIKAAEPVEVHRDLIELAEARFDGTPRNAQLFPVHLRRVRRAGEDDSGDDAVFAEVYWADKSPAPNGPLWTAFDLMKVVLGLGYIAMDNVENTRKWPAVGLVHLFTWVFYGVIAPLNALLFAGAAALLLDLTAVKIGPVVPVWALLLIVWGLTLALGLWLHERIARTYLVRIFAKGMIGFSGVLAAIVVISPGIWSGEAQQALDSFLLWSLRLLDAGWIAAVALAALTYATSLFFRKPSASHDKTLFPAVCSAMVLLWMVLSASLWLLFKEITGQLSTPRGATEPDGLLYNLLDTHLEDVLSTLTLSVVFLGALLVAAVVLVWVRGQHREYIFSRRDLIRRVILNKGLRVVLGAFLIACVVAVASQFAVFLGLLERPIFVPEQGGAISTLILAAIAGLGLFIYNAPGLVAGGLGVGRDIVTYAVQAECQWTEDDLETHKKNFPLRREINARFKRVLQYALPAYRPTRLTVISHSQGTVIATQMLQDPSVHRLLAKHGVADILLITMGSPVTHIYRHYFPEHFQVSWTGLPPGSKWVNIHRADDFVGTTIDDALESVQWNLRVDAGGHTGYFTDHQVWRELYGDEVEFSLFPTPRRSPESADPS